MRSTLRIALPAPSKHRAPDLPSRPRAAQQQDDEAFTGMSTGLPRGAGVQQPAASAWRP
jgi:hypothetical protein